MPRYQFAPLNFGSARTRRYRETYCKLFAVAPKRHDEMRSYALATPSTSPVAAGTPRAGFVSEALSLPECTHEYSIRRTTPYHQCKSSYLQSQIVSNLFLCQLPERRLEPTRALDLACFKLFLGRHGDDTDLYRLLRHLALKPFLERQQRRVNGIFQAYVVVVSARTGSNRNVARVRACVTGAKEESDCQRRSDRDKKGFIIPLL